jgi:hypothetical protein
VKPQATNDSTIWRMRVACLMIKAIRAHAHADAQVSAHLHTHTHTHTHTHVHSRTKTYRSNTYSFSRAEWFHERVSVLTFVMRSLPILLVVLSRGPPCKYKGLLSTIVNLSFATDYFTEFYNQISYNMSMLLTDIISIPKIRVYKQNMTMQVTGVYEITTNLSQTTRHNI